MGVCAHERSFVPSLDGPRRDVATVVTGDGDCYLALPVRRPERIEVEGAGPDDAALVAAMARGDADALGILYDRHSTQMFALAKRIVVAASAAEDIVQEVFLEAWKKAASYDPARGAVKSWLLLRTRSRSIDFRRAASQARASVVDDDFWAEHAAVPASDVSFAPDQAAVRRALAGLPHDQREALWLGYFEGLSSSEIAARMGSPVGTVKTRVAAALAKLRAALSDRQGEMS
jgi:RNA polymerase sigma-70 factor (ECF subfamily)